MRWLGDECVSASLVMALRAAGHDVLYVAETAAGLSDTDVIALASRENRLLLTEDKDFGDLVFRWRRPVPGVVLMRVDLANPELKAARLFAAIERSGEEFFGRYTVIEEARMRSRPLREMPSR
jgi:predicted nuclease of predicted toxin-antitoxin system